MKKEQIIKELTESLEKHPPRKKIAELMLLYEEITGKPYKPIRESYG